MPTSQSPAPSPITLDRVIPKASRFLTALVDKPEIFRALSGEDGGFTVEEFARGSALLIGAMGLVQSAAAAPVPSNQVARDALATCDRLDDLLVVRVQNALQFDFPDECGEILDGVTPTTGVGAAGNLKLVTDRIATLRAAAVADALTERRQRALGRLAAVGLTEAQLHSYATLADSALALEPPGPSSLQLPNSDERLQSRIALYWWLKGWSNIARRLVTNRNQLISLGLASRRVVDGAEVFVDQPIDQPAEGTPTVV